AQAVLQAADLRGAGAAVNANALAVVAQAGGVARVCADPVAPDIVAAGGAGDDQTVVVIVRDDVAGVRAADRVARGVLDPDAGTTVAHPGPLAVGADPVVLDHVPQGVLNGGGTRDGNAVAVAAVDEQVVRHHIVAGGGDHHPRPAVAQGSPLGGD